MYLRVKETGVHYPVNGQGGLYVLIEGSRQEIYKGKANRLAMETANQKGWKGSGQTTIGIPTREGIDLYTRAYWFHDRS
ncbi:hypothetical protein [Cohnella zeiphila]|uniref:hypothetical protein n=1 Tax=Cohnella zeiphila TaxID=2761120 RepID=UPI003B588243